MDKETQKKVEDLLAESEKIADEIDRLMDEDTEEKEFHIPVGTEVTITHGIFSGRKGIVNDYIADCMFPYEVLVTIEEGKIGQYMWYSESYIKEPEQKITFTRKRDKGMYKVTAKMGKETKTMRTNDPDFLFACSMLMSEMNADA